MYPYKQEFEQWCKTNKSLSDSTIERISLAINSFWNFYINNAPTNANVSSVNESDLRAYLTNLETKSNLKPSTINKYLSYIKNYFKYLFSHNLNSFYPTLRLKGREINRKRLYKINWDKDIAKLTKYEDINPLTIKLLTAISLGYLPKDVLKLKFADVINKLDNNTLINYFENNLKQEKIKDQYFITNKFNRPYSYESSIQAQISKDAELLDMPLTLSSLRLGFIYTYLNKSNLSDSDLRNKLNLETKSLIYYKQQLLYFVNTKDFVLPDSNNKR